MSAAPTPYRICFVCTGNICRSPIAEVVMRALIGQRGLQQRIEVDSAGTGEWHIGEQADRRALAVLAAHGYDGQAHRAQLVQPQLLTQRDLIIALDRSHQQQLHDMANNPQERQKVVLMRSFDQPVTGSEYPQPTGTDLDVADPYYENDQAFETVLSQVENACKNLLDWVQTHNL